MRTSALIAICILVATLSGCAARWTVFGHSIGGPTPPAGDDKPTVAANPAAVPAAWKVSGVELTFTASGRDELASDPRFNENELLAAIEAELRTHERLDELNPQTADRLGIVIDDFTTRPSTNAVVFGYALSTGTLAGEVELLAADGKALQTSRIRARARLTEPVGPGRAAFFAPLYHGFAALTVRNLTGAAEPVGTNH